MKITVSQFAGFCEGVKRAYEIAESLDMGKAKKPIYILGSLVHNPEVNQKIAKKGIIKIDRKYFFKAKSGEIGTLIIAAHGAGPDVYEKVKKIGAQIIDATCPKVLKVQRLAKIYGERGYKIIICGDKQHKEVLGIMEWGKVPAKIISDEKDLKAVKISNNDQTVLLSQTTQDEDFFKKAVKYLEKKYPWIKIVSTICRTTHDRQEEVKKMAEKNDLMIVVGGKESANTRRLYEISRSINPRTYFIQKSADVKKSWFKNMKKVGLAAGASTPPWIIDDIIEKLKKI